METACTDRLDALLNHFPVKARILHSGAMSGAKDFIAPACVGQMHLVRAGELRVIHPGRAPIEVTTPSLLIYPRPLDRRFVPDLDGGTEMACAELEFHGGGVNPIAAALPDVVCLPLDEVEGMEPVLQLLFSEAFNLHCGRHPMLARLLEVVLIQVLRVLMEAGTVAAGMLAGMGHPRLRKALVAMHDQPRIDWSLDALADLSGMSRSAFASTFRKIVGCTPGAYMQGWRVSLTQQALLREQPLKRIAVDVGYGSEEALLRAFKAVCGVTPKEWRMAQVLH